MDAINVPTAGKTEVPGPELKTPPEAIKRSGAESSISVPGPRKRPHRSIEGARELRCMECGGFFGEVKLKGVIEDSRFRCHRCKAWSSFVFSS